MRISKGSRSAALIMAAMLAGLAHAQDSTPLIRTSTHLVLLDVVVTDKAGHPIRGLTRDDFTVLENGVPQNILSFEESAPDREAPAAADPNSGVATANASHTIILLDELNIAFSDLAYARDRIVLFLEQNPVEHQPTSLMAIGLHGLEMVQDFTRDSSQLKDKLMHLKPVTANPVDGYMDPGKSREHAQEALGALTQIARAAVGSPYSFNVIWVTSGFSGMLDARVTSGDVEAGLKKVTNLLIRSRMRLYTINPAGVAPLTAMAGTPPTSRGSILGAKESAAEKLLGSTHGGTLEADAMLNHLTSMMGGLSYYRRNDVEQALSQAIVDASSAYVVSYAPSNTNFNGEYRSIEVRTKVDGASTRTRRGYYALADEPAPDPNTKDLRLTTALTSPILYAGWNVTCPLTYDASKGRLSGNLTITPRPRVRETDQTGQIIRAAALSGDGKVLSSRAWQVNWKSSWTNRVVTAYFDKVLPPKTRNVRFLIADTSADRIGTCEYRIPAR